MLLVAGSATVVSSKTTMFYQDELGGGLHGWGRFLHFAMILWAKKRELGRVTCIPDGKGVEGVRWPCRQCPAQDEPRVNWHRMPWFRAVWGKSYGFLGRGVLGLLPGYCDFGCFVCLSLNYSNKLLLHVINDILPSQPVSMRCIDGYTVAAKNLFDCVLFRNDIPVTELPPCLLTEMLYNKGIVLQASWDVRKENQLRSIYSTLPLCNFVPSQEAIRGCSREVLTTWSVSPIEAYVQFERQSDQSYMKLAVEIGIRSIDKYLLQLGPSAATQTKNVLIHGIPGSGKS